VKAKKRVVTSAVSRPAPKRTPTVRRIRPAIVPLGRPPSVPRPTGQPSSTSEDWRSRPPSDAWIADPSVPGNADEAPEVDLSVNLGRGLVLRNPITAASGPFGFGVEHGESVEVDRLGAVCTRGVTLNPRNGNPVPRMAEVPAGLLSSVGLQNPGISAVLERYEATWRALRTAIIVNLCGDSAAEFVALVRQLEGTAGIDGIELNLGCANQSRGGMQFGLDPESAAALTGAVRRATDLPLLVKLSPAAVDIRAVARAVEDAGADALSAVNTLPGLAVAPGRERPLLGTAYGGLSGPALRPIAQRVVFEVTQVVEIPVLAAGGITCLDDVLDFLALGASAVQVGTAVLGDPQLPVRLVDGLAAECRRRGLSTHRPLVGTALPKRTAPPSTRAVEYRA
jgi:dihydroorotate dehydrogenase (NAD+) catalytic subunit